jgi:hypothetical protein
MRTQSFVWTLASSDSLRQPFSSRRHRLFRLFVQPARRARQAITATITRSCAAHRVGFAPDAGARASLDIDAHEYFLGRIANRTGTAARHQSNLTKSLKIS